jgi:hypothetical protein
MSKTLIRNKENLKYEDAKMTEIEEEKLKLVTEGYNRMDSGYQQVVQIEFERQLEDIRKNKKDQA